MRFVLITLLALVSVTLFANNGTDPVKTMNIDTQASTVNWKGYKVTGSHEGTINVSSGSLEFDGENLIGGNLVIDMTSLKSTDLEGGSAQKLDGHLKSDDFFGVNSFPFAKFTITKVVSRGLQGEFKVTGQLTIKDTTKEVKFNTKINDGVAVANIKIDRSDFNVRYGSGSFFDNLGDKTIYDEFDLALNLVIK